MCKHGGYSIAGMRVCVSKTLSYLSVGYVMGFQEVSLSFGGVVCVCVWGGGDVWGCRFSGGLFSELHRFEPQTELSLSSSRTATCSV